MMINLDIYHISFEEADIMRALCITDTESKKSEFYQVIVYYGKNVPLFRRNGYRKPGAMIP